ncbi:kinase-like protein [Exidia glandulosa HHB12029]|uniref:Kinase-like protein n=1 Tax=Exidia glandulosa HHB12029 TaxID=1314781 RepID=A0A165KK57_EXIGL|nr:kinase-like protein [Exidia glandulosa HHB12029]
MYFTPYPSASVQGSYCPGTPPSSASSSQSLGQGVTSTSGPSGGATVIPAGMHNAAYQHWRTHVAPHLGIEQVENELLPPSEFWTWFNAWFAHGPDAQAQVQAPAQGVTLNQPPVAALAQPPATAFGHPPDATSSTVRNPPFGAATLCDDGCAGKPWCCRWPPSVASRPRGSYLAHPANNEFVVSSIPHSYLDAQKDVAFITRDQLTDLAPLGAGGFGTTKRAHYADNGIVAVKVVKEDNQYRMGRGLFLLKREGTLHSRLRHKNIVNFIAFCETDDGLAIVMDCADSGDIGAYSKSHPEARMCMPKLLSDVACGLNYCHTQDTPLVHGDLHPGNILVHGRRALLADFGISPPVVKGVPTERETRPTSSLPASQDVTRENTAAGIWGLRCCLAPEVLNGAHRTPASDMYAFGVLVVELYEGRRWHTDGKLCCLRKDDEAPKKPTSLDAQLYTFTLECFLTDTAGRPSALRAFEFWKVSADAQGDVE